MADEFVSATRLAELTQQLRAGQPMSPVYIAPEDFLVVNHWNIATEVDLRLFGRLLRADGVTVPLEQSLRLRTDGVMASDVIVLAEGYLLSAGVRDYAGLIERGQCYASLLLVRGRNITSQQYAYLATGYVDELQPLIWPWGARNEAQMSGPGYMETRGYPNVT